MMDLGEIGDHLDHYGFAIADFNISDYSSQNGYNVNTGQVQLARTATAQFTIHTNSKIIANLFEYGSPTAPKDSLAYLIHCYLLRHQEPIQIHLCGDWYAIPFRFDYKQSQRDPNAVILRLELKVLEPTGQKGPPSLSDKFTVPFSKAGAKWAGPGDYDEDPPPVDFELGDVTLKPKEPPRRPPIRRPKKWV